MTLVQLEYVVALASYKHFTTAAKKCFVTQPTLTMQVKKLEDEIGAKLFDRSKKPLEPTAIGIPFIEKAREILEEAKQLKDSISVERFSVEGSFRIGIIPTLAPYLLPLFLPHFIQKHTKTTLVIEELESLQMIQRIKNNSIDIGIMATPLQEKSLREIALFNEPFLSYLPPQSPLLQQKIVTAQQLEPFDALVLAEGHCFRNQTLNICNANLSHSLKGFQYQSGSIETLIKMVDNNLGYTLIPQLAINKKLNTNRIKHFDQPEPVREISLICRKSFAKERLIEILRESILNVLPQNLEQNQNYQKVRWR